MNVQDFGFFAESNFVCDEILPTYIPTQKKKAEQERLPKTPFMCYPITNILNHHSIKT